MKKTIILLSLIALVNSTVTFRPAPTYSANIETVELVKSIDDENFIIRRANGELWLLEAKTFCFWTWLKEGTFVLAVFDYLTTKLINPDNGEVCECWTEKQLD